MNTSRTALYRHYDADSNLLYVGISLSATYRLKQHQASVQWAHDAVRMETQWFDNRKDAEAAERSAIREEKPKFNVAHTKPTKSQCKVKPVISKTGSDNTDYECKPNQEYMDRIKSIFAKRNEEHKAWLERINCPDDPCDAVYCCTDEYKQWCDMSNFIGPVKLKNNPPPCYLCGGKTVFDYIREAAA